MSVAAGEEGGKLAVDGHWEVEHRAHEAVRHAEEDAGQSDVAPPAEHSTMSVAADEEDGLIAVNDHWEVEHRTHVAGAEMPVEEGDEHSGKNSNVASTHKWTTSHRQKYVVRSASRYK